MVGDWAKHNEGGLQMRVFLKLLIACVTMDVVKQGMIWHAGVGARPFLLLWLSCLAILATADLPIRGDITPTRNVCVACG